MIESHLSSTNHVIYLDWHHLQEKIYQHLSTIFIERRLPNSDEIWRVYVRVFMKGQLKPPKRTSHVRPLQHRIRGFSLTLIS